MSSETADPTPAGRVWKTPAGVNLGPLDQIADGRARNFVLQIGERRFHGFVVRRGMAVFGYVDSCPHAGWPLAGFAGRFLTRDDDLILCGGHAALFRIEDGVCLAGPCPGQSLTPWPVRVEAGEVRTA